MTRAEALKKIEAVAKEHGFNTGRGMMKDLWISPTGNPRYVNFTIAEYNDPDRCDWNNYIYAGHFEVTASVSRMGGEPDAAELFEAARQIEAAARLIQKLETEDLSYVRLPERD